MTTDMDENVKTIIDSKGKNMRISNPKVKPKESSSKKREYKKSLPKLKENSNIRDFIKAGKKEFKVYEDERPLPLHVHHKISVTEKEAQTDPIIIVDINLTKQEASVDSKETIQKNIKSNSKSFPDMESICTSDDSSTEKELNPALDNNTTKNHSSDLTSTPSSLKDRDVKQDREDLEEEIMKLGEDSDETYKLMMGEDIPEDYWKLLAETRREALDESLQENKELHEEVTKLKSENNILIDILSKNDSYSSILQTALEKENSAMSDEEEESDDDDDD